VDSDGADIGKHRGDDPLTTPLTHTDFSNLGPLYYQMAEMDIWRDSGLFYSELLCSDGNAVKIDVYPGVPHLWWSMYPQLSINKKWAKDLVDGVDWLLKVGQERPPSSKL
jgi:acetyl esterase/lipase